MRDRTKIPASMQHAETVRLLDRLGLSELLEVEVPVDAQFRLVIPLLHRIVDRCQLLEERLATLEARGR